MTKSSTVMVSNFSPDHPLVLDCTFRDGGYYNDWDFDASLVEKYLKVMKAAGVHCVELGFRNFPQSKYLGPFAYTSDAFLELLNIPEGLNIGVMLDAKTVLSSGLSVKKAIKCLFNERAKSIVSIVRVAAHVSEVPRCSAIIAELAGLGYETGLNVMQAGYRSDEELNQALSEFSAYQHLQVLYFADSFGNMDSAEVCRLVDLFSDIYDGDLGIHTHDNMSRGLSNSVTAAEKGVRWLDSTVAGMGRGAGNTKTEELLFWLELKGSSAYKAHGTASLSVTDFYPLRNKLGWGSNIHYFFAAHEGIHPTYAQKLLADRNLTPEEQLASLYRLRKESSRGAFSELTYATCISNTFGTVASTGGGDCRGLFDKKKILILGSGESLFRHKEPLQVLVSNGDYTVVAVNEALIDIEVDFIVASHNSRFSTLKKALLSREQTLIAPLGRFSDEERTIFDDRNVLDIGFHVSESCENRHNLVVSQFDVTLAFLLGILAQSQPENIFLAGFDGYQDAADPRHKEMIELITVYSSLLSVDLVSITPTAYPMQERSLYAFL